MRVITLTFILSILCLAGAKYCKKELSLISKLLLFLSWIMPTIIVGCRSWEVGTDSLMYARQFEQQSSSLTLRNFLSPGYTAICTILHIVGLNNYTCIFFFMASVTFAFLIAAIWKQSDMPALTLYIFFCFGQLNESVNQYRQFLSVCIVFYAFTYLNRNRKKYYVLALFAVSIHPTAIISLLIPLFLSFRTKNDTYMLSVIILSLPFFYISLPLIRQILQSMPYFGNYIGSSFDIGITFNGIFVFIVRFCIFIWLLIYKKQCILPNFDRRIFFNTTFYGLILQSLALVFPVSARIPIYYIQSSTLLIPSIISDQYQRVKNTTLLTMLLIVIFLGSYFIIRFISMGYAEQSYSFFWQRTNDIYSVPIWTPVS